MAPAGVEPRRMTETRQKSEFVFKSKPNNVHDHLDDKQNLKVMSKFQK